MRIFRGEGCIIDVSSVVTQEDRIFLPVVVVVFLHFFSALLALFQTQCERRCCSTKLCRRTHETPSPTSRRGCRCPTLNIRRSTLCCPCRSKSLRLTALIALAREVTDECTVAQGKHQNRRHVNSILSRCSTPCCKADLTTEHALPEGWAAEFRRDTSPCTQEF